MDDLSSAHVYLRLPDGKDWKQDIPADTLEDCAQLVKANSIQGSKRNTVDVVYTPWNNLKKTASMEVGQVRELCLCCSAAKTCQLCWTVCTGHYVTQDSCAICFASWFLRAVPALSI